MTWFNVDDGFYDHPKVLAIPPADADAAIALWTRAGSWCARQLTNGRIPAYQIRAMNAKVRAINSLVAFPDGYSAGLWVPDLKGGFIFHDWQDWNQTREQVEKRRAATRDRVAAYRSRATGNPVGNATGNATGNGVTNGVSNTSPSQAKPSQAIKTLGESHSHNDALVTARSGASSWE